VLPVSLSVSFLPLALLKQQYNAGLRSRSERKKTLVSLRREEQRALDTSRSSKLSDDVLVKLVYLTLPVLRQ
jgi:hypothetical protein